VEPADGEELGGFVAVGVTVLVTGGAVCVTVGVVTTIDGVTVTVVVGVGVVALPPVSCVPNRVVPLACLPVSRSLIGRPAISSMLVMATFMTAKTARQVSPSRRRTVARLVRRA
jgi:hypothetical protein